MKPPDRAEPLDDAETTTYLLVDSVLALSTATFGAVGTALRELDLSEPVANLLWHLDPRLPAPTMGELAGKLYCDPSTVTFLVGKLEHRVLAERHPAPNDRRSKVVTLTEEGRRVRARLVEIVTTRTPMENLTRREQDQLLRLARKALGQPGVPDGLEQPPSAGS